MSFFKASILQIRSHLHIYVVAYIVLLTLLYLFADIAERYDMSVAYFTRDPAITLYGHPFTGVISNIGILFWCFSLAICFFCSWLILKKGEKQVSVFLFFSGLFTLLLMLDDFFMFHEFIFPYSFGIPQEAVIVGYLVMISMYFLKFGRLILTMEYTILLMACGLFALSLATDIWMPQSDLQFLVEDGAKLFGIVTWFIFFIRTCYAQTVRLIER